MKNIFYASLTFIVITISSCNSNEKLEAPDSRIIIVNVKDANRRSIASIIDNLNGCNPKVVGLNIFFDTDKSSIDDSVLIKSIKNAGNVVVLDLIEKHLQTEIGIAAKRIAYSTTYEERDKIYCPLAVDYEGRFLESMGLVLAMEYNSHIIIDFILANGNTKWPFELEEIYKENYTVIEIDSIDSNCQKMKDKIVLLDDMRTRKTMGDKKVFTAFLTASLTSYVFNKSAKESNE